MPRPTVDELLDMIAAQHRQAVIDTIVELTESEGLDAAVSLLAAIQFELGARWHNGTWSIADEHAATATVDLALAAAALRVPTPIPAVGTVVVACAEEDWHILPARMLVEQLRWRRWDVTFLSGSTSAEHLGAYLSAIGPTALAVSCSTPIYLPGARRSIAASHLVGVPVIVGGAAFGNNVRRARAVGADGWAMSANDADVILSSWARNPPALAEPADDSEQRALSADRPTYVDAAMTTLAAQFPAFSSYSPWQQAKTREDFDYIVRFVEAALLTGDDNIIIDFAQWLTHLLDVRGLPPGIVPLSVRSLLAGIPPTQSSTRRLLELAARTSEGET